MLPCTAKETLVKQIAFNDILYTEVSSKLFYSLTMHIIFFSHIFSQQSLKAALHFVHVRRGYFQPKGIDYSW